MSRILDFTSVHNFRDFGDYSTDSGRSVLPGRLFRSAHLNMLNTEDHSRVEDLDIGLIVDLRYKPERTRQPNRLPQKRVPRVLEYPDGLATETSDIAPHEKFLKKDLVICSVSMKIYSFFIIFIQNRI